MIFKEFYKLMQEHINSMLREKFLFVTEAGKDLMWETYLSSFPAGTNEIFRERREFDCNCCKRFIRAFGNVVIIKDNKLISIWDFTTDDEVYQPVINAMSELVKVPVTDVFVTKEAVFGTEKNVESLTFLTWHHFYIKIPKTFVDSSPKTVGTVMSLLRSVKQVLKRSLEELTQESVEIVLDLIAQDSLYKGLEVEEKLKTFLSLKIAYSKLPEEEKENFCWINSVILGGAIGKIRNHAIGVLLIDLSEDMELDRAVKRYESEIVPPENYKRPTSYYPPKMVDQAYGKLVAMGLENSIERRYATIRDVGINDVLFANKEAQRGMVGDVFSELKKEASSINPKKFEKVEEVGIVTFIKDILPSVRTIEMLLENRHTPNLVSVIAQKNDGKSLFKWNNGLTWAYEGNLTDSSMKQRVKAAGGKVDGVLRFSIQWNEKADNNNDFDAHCLEPNKNEIYYPNKKRIHPSSGMLDVDIITPGSKVAVENITWTDIRKMQEGIYHFFVNCYTHRGGTSGFSAEIEYNGEIYSYEYRKDIPHLRKVTVAKLSFSREHGIKFITSLDSTTSSKKVWGLDTNQFHPVSVCMLSPNYWEEQGGIGNKHFFFILGGCLNKSQPNGFFNEFLKEEFTEYRKVFAPLGQKMRVEPSDNQLSGLGFSSTKRNSVICKLTGSFTRVVKLVF